MAYYFESLSYAKGDALLWHPLIDLGDIYYLQKQYDSAFFYYKQYIDTIKYLTTDSAVRYGFTMNPLTGIGETFLAKKEYEKALTYFKEPLEHNRKANDQQQVMRVLLDIARSYYGKKDYKAALNNARGCLQIAEKFRAKQYLRDGNQLMFSIYDRFKKTDSAYFFYRLYMDMKDSMSIEQFDKKVALYDAVEEDRKKKTEITLLNNQNEINQQKMKIQQSALKRKSLLLYIFIASSLTMILLAILVSRNIKLKRRKEQLQQLVTEANVQQKLTQLNKEKTDLEMQALRAQMNPHFIFNCLSSVNRFILINRTEEASDYLTKFSRLIRMALHNSEKSYITLENELEALRLYLDLERLRFKNAFNYSISLINTIDVSAVFIPPMLLQPFIENAIWHGLMHKQDAGFLDIALSIEEKILTCIMTDRHWQK